MATLLATVEGLRTQLVAAELRQRELVEHLIGLKRSGFEPAQPVGVMPEPMDDLPSVVRTAISDRAGGDGSFLENYARLRLAEQVEPTDVAREIYEGGEA